MVKVEEFGSRSLDDHFQLLQQVVVGAPTGIAVFDREMNYLLVSRRFLSDYQLTDPDILGRNHYDVFPEMPELWKAVHRRCLAGTTERATEDALPRQGGGLDWVDWEIQPWYTGDGAIGGIVLFSEVVTERKQRREQVRLSEERFRATFEQAAVGIAHVSLEGRFLRINQRLCDIVGYPYDELLGLTFQDLTYPEELETDLAQMRRLLDGEIADYSLEKRYVHKDGTAVWVNLTVALVGEAGANPNYFIAVVESIEKRKRAQEKSRKLEEKLRQYQKMEAVGQLAGGVAHDLNNLLTPILGYGDLLANDQELGEWQRNAIKEVLRAGERARDLVRQLLAFGRKLPLEFKPLDINAVIEGFAGLLRRTIPENIVLRSQLAPGLGVVLADTGQIEQIIMNLVVNAADAMPAGGDLLITTAMSDLEEDEAGLDLAPGRYVTLSVNDTGCGMDRETREHAFEPFFSTKQERGTGLGLATVFGIVKQHGGGIWIYSEPGQGSTFRIYLPVTAAPLEEARKPRQVTQDPLGSETVLLVEDNDQVRRLARTLLDRQGYTVLEAGDGEAALKILAGAGGEVDLLLTDVVLPGINGKQLFDAAVTLRPQLKVLYMSGYPDEVITHHGALQPGVHFIQKPYSGRDLAVRIREILDPGA